MIRISLIIGFIPVFFLASCANKLSEAQKASLNQVMVSRPAVEATDLKAADGTQSPNASTGVPMATGGGLIGALIGTAIDAGVTAHQANQFKKQYGYQLDQVQAQIPRNPGQDLRDRTTKVLKKDPFFSSRLVESGAPNRFEGDLLSYGLVRYSRKSDQTVLGLQLSCNVWLMDASGKKLCQRMISVRSTDSYTIHDYAAKPALMKRVYGQMLDAFEGQVKSHLDSQLNR